jgi:hypothetical protein
MSSMDSIGPPESIPRLPDASTTFRDALQPLERGDSETWSCQAFCPIHVLWLVGVGPPHRFEMVYQLLVVSNHILLTSAIQDAAQWLSRKPRDSFDVVHDDPTANSSLMTTNYGTRHMDFIYYIALPHASNPV